MRTGNRGGEIEHAKTPEALGRDISGISPFCHSGLLKAAVTLGCARTLSAAVIAGKLFSAWGTPAAGVRAQIWVFFRSAAKLELFLHGFNYS
jgi:hypothetical protein